MNAPRPGDSAPIPPSLESATTDDESVVRAEQRLSEVEALSGIGSWEWDITSDRLDWSEQLCRIYGVPIERRHRTYDDFVAAVHPDDREQVKAIVQHAFDERTAFEIEHRVVWPNGDVRTIHSRGYVLVDADGQPARMLGSAQDVTDERAREVERRAAERRIAAGQARDDALALLAHDLRSPLAVVVGYVQLLERQARSGALDPEKVGPYLERVNDAARQITSLLDDLLADASPDAEMEALETEPVDLTGLARRIVEQQDEMTRQHAFRIEAPDRPIVANVNASKIGRAIQNLLANAVKYSPDGGAITVSLEESADEVAISVSDDGIGIPAEDLPLIFERFHRGANVAGSTSGLGLGLTSVLRGAEAHGGRVEVSSVEREGTTFTIRLPRGG